MFRTAIIVTQVFLLAALISLALEGSDHILLISLLIAILNGAILGLSCTEKERNE